MKEKNTKSLWKTIIFIAVLAFVLLLSNKTNVVLASNESTDEDQFCYLSDISYVKEKSNAASGHSIRLDTNDSGSMLKLKVDNNEKSFYKGICAWASSQIVYDLREYNYDYFTAYLGVDVSENNNYFNTGLRFFIYTSDDGENWGEAKASTGTMYASSNAQFVQVEITGAKYLKLVADKNSNNWWAEWYDEALYADAKLIKEGYEEDTTPIDFIKTVNQYDEIIKGYDGQEITGEYEKVLLQRELVKNAGYDTLQFLAKYKNSYKETIEWLMNDSENLRLYILGGQPDGGNYRNSIILLSDLHDEYESDFTNNERLNNKWYPEMTYKDLYKKMAITLSLTHSQNVGLWMQSGSKENKSDALRRYAIYRYLHKDGKLRASDSLDFTPWFEALQVEEMRFIMNNAIDDEEILWLNAYVKTKIIEEPNRAWLTPHPHIAYVWPNYANDVYYVEENKEYFNDLFKVNQSTLNADYVEDINKNKLFDLKYKIPGGKNTTQYEIQITRGTSSYKLYKVWMNFRNKFGTGAVCGGISKSGSNIRATHGIPATVIGQPGHAALLFYSKDAQGKGYWNIDNDVSGWTLSEKGERLLLGWGNANTNYARGSYQVVYMALAQEAINDYENLEKCEKMVMLANSYEGNLAKQEEIYRKALEIQPINVDAWLGLINVYNQSNTKTQDEYFALAEEVGEKLKYFPLPMQQLTNLIQPKLTTMGNEEQNLQNSYKFTLLQTRILKEGSTLPNNTADNYSVYQPGVTRVEANYLLGKLDKEIATFSFDGLDAGKIVLTDRFNGSGVRWEYCINGQTRNESKENKRGDGWTEVSFTAEEEHKLQLTPKQIASITSENDIYIHIVGVNYDENNLYKIDITEQELPNNLYANDLENRVVGVNLNTEWRYTERDKWTSYSVASPDLTGTKTVQVRQAATGTKLTSPVSTMYEFTLDNQLDTRKYIPVSHLSIHSVSTEATAHQGHATNAIDANYNTRWHSAWNGTDTNRYITIKLDNPVYLSAVEFVPAGGGNGRINDGTIWGSMDGENWEILTSRQGITYPSQANTIEQAKALTQNFEIDEPKEVQYVKIVADKTNGNWFTARAFNFYQDLTKKPHLTEPTASVTYSTTQPTNGIVVARLTNPSTKITITNNSGNDTYVFTKNGEFTFEFEDENGNKGSTLAKVDWIDKNGPTADVKYELDADKKLLILLDNISEDVYLLDENNNKINYVEVQNGKISSIAYLDHLGNQYKVAEIDENGEVKKITYKNTTGKVSSVNEYVTTLTNGVVTKEEYFGSAGESIAITNEVEKETLRTLQQAISNPLEQVLETSGDYEFRILDKASNISYKSIKVDYIDNDTKILASDITYDITNATNKDVVATIKTYIIDTNGNKNANVKITNNGGKDKYTFTKNGQFTFEYKDASKAEDYQVKQHTAKVNWIDKNAPTAEIKYSSKEATDKAVVTLVNESESIIITNNGSNREYTFTQNGEFTFEFEDMAGNKGTAKATVDWLEEGKLIFKSNQYKINESVSGIKPKTTLKEFTKNCETNGTITIYKQDGTILGENELVGTGMTLKVKKGKEEISKGIATIGDTDGNGEVTPTDLADAIQMSLGENNLNTIQTLAVDINEDGEITPTDLAEMIQLTLE